MGPALTGCARRRCLGMGSAGAGTSRRGGTGPAAGRGRAAGTGRGPEGTGTEGDARDRASSVREDPRWSRGVAALDGPVEAGGWRRTGTCHPCRHRAAVVRAASSRSHCSARLP